KLGPCAVFLAAEQPSLAALEHNLVARSERHLDVVIDLALLRIVDAALPGTGIDRYHVDEQWEADDWPIPHGGILVAGVSQRPPTRILRVFQPNDLAADATTALLDLHLGGAVFLGP